MSKLIIFIAIVLMLCMIIAPFYKDKDKERVDLSG